MAFVRPDLRGVSQLFGGPMRPFQMPAPEPQATQAVFHQGTGMALEPSQAGQVFLEQFQKDNPNLPQIKLNTIGGNAPQGLLGYFSSDKPDTLNLKPDTTLSTLAHEAEHLKRYNNNPSASPYQIFDAAMKKDPQTMWSRTTSWNSNYGEDFKDAMQTGFQAPVFGHDGRVQEMRLFGYPMVEEESAANRAGQQALLQQGTPAQLAGFNNDIGNWMYPAGYGGDEAATGLYATKTALKPVFIESDTTPNFATAPSSNPLKLALEVEPALRDEVGPVTFDLIQSYIGSIPR